MTLRRAAGFLLTATTMLGTSQAATMALANAPTELFASEEVWQLSDAARFGDIGPDHVAIARQADFCSRDGIVLRSNNKPSSPDPKQDNIIVRPTALGVEVWLALAPDVSTTRDAVMRYTLFLSNSAVQACGVGEPVLALKGVDVIGLESFAGKDGAVEFDFLPPSWKCGSFMAPRCEP